MSEHNYDSYCGIYCGACDIHAAYKTGRKTRLSTFWSEPLLKTFLRSQRVDYKDSRTLQLQCDGCKSDNVFINCKICRIRACARDKKVEHCIDCGEYPCAMIVGRKKIEGLLPHLKCTHSNMETIRKNGVAQWLLQQEKQWQCPDCRTSLRLVFNEVRRLRQGPAGESIQIYFRSVGPVKAWHSPGIA